MNTFTKITAIAAITVVSTTGAFAGSAISELSSANTVSFSTVTGTSDNVLLSANAQVMERVDLDSLRARVSQNSSVLRQLEAYGASLDDVIGITGTSSSEITLYIRG